MPDGTGSRKTLIGRMFPQPRVVAGEKEVLLDDALGAGFSVLVHSNRPGTASPALVSEPWRKLAARIVVMRPDSGEAGANSVRALDSDPRLARYRDHVMLLRPDRYVAACIPIDGLDEGAGAIGSLIAATFTPRRS